VATKVLLIEQHAHSMAEVSVEYDVVTVDLFAALKLHAAGTAAIKKHASNRCGGANLGPFFTSNLRKGLADAAKTTHDVIHTMSVLSVGNHSE